MERAIPLYELSVFLTCLALRSEARVRQRIYNRQRHILATPHIAGAMALLWSAIPNLATTAYRESRCFEYLRCPHRFDSMRRCGSTKQCVRLVSGRYFRRGGRYTNADAHCYSDGDRHANYQPHCNDIATATPRHQRL